MTNKQKEKITNRLTFSKDDVIDGKVGEFINLLTKQQIGNKYEIRVWKEKK